ncbi:MAG TPA: Sec-independent protein translocase protein TatB [Acidimicrobiales bacterium]|nr:Sec-independent protein translocase protein TatB [Acidimicrobiales bacterium]
MFNVGGGELLVILLLALIVLGPQKLPGAVRTAGRVMGEVRRISSGFQQELKTAFDEADVDQDLPRRRESAPLAATVADAEAEARVAAYEPGAEDREPAPADDLDDLPSAPRPVGGGDGPTVAPAVAAALDEIVTPLNPVPSPPVASATNSSRDDDPGQAPGDERAAS